MQQHHIRIKRWTVYYYWIIKIHCCQCNKPSYNLIYFLAFQHDSTTKSKHTHARTGTLLLINLTHKVSDMSSPPVLCYRGRWREGPIRSRTHLSTLWITVPRTALCSARDCNRLRCNAARGAILDLDATDSGPCNGYPLTLFRMKGWEAAGTRTENIHTETGLCAT